MRILHIVPHYWPAVTFGGPPVVVHNLASRMAKTEDVTVYTTDVLDKSRRIRLKFPEVINGVKVFYFPNLNHNLASNYNIYLPLTMYYYLLRNINQFDVVHSHEYYTFTHLLTAALIKKSEQIHVLSGHGTLKPLAAASRLKRKKIYHALFTKYIFSSISTFIANTKHERQDYLDLGILDTQIKIIPNGIDLDIFNIKNNLQFKKSRYNFQGKPKILYLGRIQQKKGLELLIKALFVLINDYPQISCIIAGPIESPAYYYKLRQLVNSLKIDQHVIFLDTVIGEEKLALLSNADIFVLPSYGEGLATVLLEAAAAKIPIVVTKTAVASEFEREQAAQICQLNSYDVAQKIKLVLTNKDLRQEQVRKARKLVKKTFSIEKVTKQTLDLYENLLKKQ